MTFKKGLFYKNLFEHQQTKNDFESSNKLQKIKDKKVRNFLVCFQLLLLQANSFLPVFFVLTLLQFLSLVFKSV
jgi:hypothetical protein